MALVDFSNAVLDVFNSEETPFSHGDYLELKHDFWSNNSEVSKPTMNILVNTPTKVSIAYSGTFSRSGTEFYIAYRYDVGTFRVSNISFNSGDEYSFIIDIEIEGNT